VLSFILAVSARQAEVGPSFPAQATPLPEPAAGESSEEYRWRADAEHKLHDVGILIQEAYYALPTGGPLDASVQATISDQLQQADDLLLVAMDSERRALEARQHGPVPSESKAESQWRMDADSAQGRVHEFLGTAIPGLQSGQSLEPNGQEIVADQLELAYFHLSNARDSMRLALNARPSPSTPSASTEDTAQSEKSGGSDTPGGIVVAIVGAITGFVTAIAGLITALVTWQKARRQGPAVA
jgi:hypothetical protein